MSDNGIHFLIQEEGMVLKPYLCPAGVPTIGVGCTYYPAGWNNDLSHKSRKVKITDPPITKEQAIELLKLALMHFEQQVTRLMRDDINQHQFDALVSLCFNIGTTAFDNSTVLKMVNANPNDPAIQQAFEAWKFSAGKPILSGRRKREYRLYCH